MKLFCFVFHIGLYSLIEKIAHWADEFSTDAFGEMLAIICKCRLSPKNKSNSELKTCPPPSPAVEWQNK